MKIHRFAISAVVLGMIACGPGRAGAGFITVGTNNASPNAIPFGNFGTGEYEQVYTSSAFSGAQVITSVGFASATSNVGTTETLTIALSTTSVAVNALSTNLASNRGADNRVVFSGSYTSFVPANNGTFDLVFATSPFVYDPSKGNLLLDVTVTSASGASNSFEATQDVGVTSRAFNNFGGNIGTTSNYGLVTQFGVNAVPEPSSLALCGVAGLAGLGYAGAKRRRAA